MAAAIVNIYSPLSRLRKDNQLFLSQLKQGQNDTWDVLKRTLGETSFTFRGVNSNVVRTTEEASLVKIPGYWPVLYVLLGNSTRDNEIF